MSSWIWWELWRNRAPRVEEMLWELTKIWLLQSRLCLSAEREGRGRGKRGGGGGKYVVYPWGFFYTEGVGISGCLQRSGIFDFPGYICCCIATRLFKVDDRKNAHVVCVYTVCSAFSVLYIPAFDSNTHSLLPSSLTLFHHRSPTSSRPVTFFTVQKSNASKSMTAIKSSTK